jgi:hypothetical protein
MFKNASGLHSTSQIGNKRKFNPQDYEPRRLALCYCPPLIIIEYLKPSKGKLYHRRLSIKSKVGIDQLEELIKSLKRKYSAYFSSNKICDQQLRKLLEQLMAKGNWVKKQPQAISRNSKSLNGVQGTFSQSMNGSSTRLREKSMNTLEIIKNNFIESQSQILVCRLDKSRSLIKRERSQEQNNFSKCEKTVRADVEHKYPDDKDTQALVEDQKTQKKKPEVYVDNEEEIFESDFDDNVVDDSQMICDIENNNSECDDDDNEFDEIEFNEKSQMYRSSRKISKFDFLQNNSNLELSGLKGVDVSKDDLNKVNTRDILKIKKQMEDQFVVNSIPKDHSDFEYDKREEFEPEQSNEWDELDFSDDDQF